MASAKIAAILAKGRWVNQASLLDTPNWIRFELSACLPMSLVTGCSQYKNKADIVQLIQALYRAMYFDIIH